LFAQPDVVTVYLRKGENQCSHCLVNDPLYYNINFYYSPLERGGQGW